MGYLTPEILKYLLILTISFSFQQCVGDAADDVTDKLRFTCKLGVLSKNYCWKSWWLFMKTEKLESAGRVCRDSYNSSWTICFNWAPTLASSSSSFPMSSFLILRGLLYCSVFHVEFWVVDLPHKMFLSFFFLFFILQVLQLLTDSNQCVRRAATPCIEVSTFILKCFLTYKSANVDNDLAIKLVLNMLYPQEYPLFRAMTTGTVHAVFHGR